MFARSKQLTEVNVGLAGVGAADPRGGSDRATLVEGDELVEVVEIGEHLLREGIVFTIKHPPRL